MCFNLYALIVKTKRRRYLNLKHPLPQTPHAPFPAYPLSEYHIEAPLFSKCSYTHPHRPNPNPISHFHLYAILKIIFVHAFRAQGHKTLLCAPCSSFRSSNLPVDGGPMGSLIFTKLRDVGSRVSFRDDPSLKGQVEAG